MAHTGARTGLNQNNSHKRANAIIIRFMYLKLVDPSQVNLDLHSD